MTRSVYPDWEYSNGEWHRCRDTIEDIMRKASGMAPTPAYYGIINKDCIPMSETSNYIDKGALSRQISISPAINGGFTLNSGSYDKAAFTNADDLMAYLKKEVVKLEKGNEAEMKKNAAKKN